MDATLHLCLCNCPSRVTKEFTELIDRFKAEKLDRFILHHWKFHETTAIVELRKLTSRISIYQQKRS